MPATQTIRKKLDYLVRATGRAEADIMAAAVEEGVDDLYRKQNFLMVPSKKTGEVVKVEFANLAITPSLL